MTSMNEQIINKSALANFNTHNAHKFTSSQKKNNNLTKRRIQKQITSSQLKFINSKTAKSKQKKWIVQCQTKNYETEKSQNRKKASNENRRIPKQTNTKLDQYQNRQILKQTKIKTDKYQNRQISKQTNIKTDKY